ncbi:Nif3-like dinuclear metal center hexameric protein [Neisseria sp. Ec49-e6-T10]|uniref:Nif3-like dinuclear metal center hexameric protein n=1 Tax=Neisseria sp. Ec49-e6-T10 TaxID=3140744 RepID=UPI003EBAEAAB
MIKRDALLNWLNQLLKPELFQDYAPNGLQIEGNENINTVVGAVTASEAAIDAAIAFNADALLVHHGYFWKSEPVVLTGWKKKRIEKLLKHGINLLAYHLPLDAHPQLGNNVQLAHMMDWQILVENTPNNLLTQGMLLQEQSLESLGQQLQQKLERPPLIVGALDKTIKNIAWCTGGAQGFFQEAINLGVDAFITGEASEAQYHLSNETGVAFISAGHHATEKFGIQALINQISIDTRLDTHFFDENNPI